MVADSFFPPSDKCVCFFLTPNSEKMRNTANLITEDACSRTVEISSDVDISDCMLKPENTADQNLGSSKSQNETDFLTETFLSCTLSSDSCGELAEENEQNSSHCTTMVRESGLNSHETSLSEQELYNSFHFWRTPLPEIDIDLELQQASDIIFTPEIQEGTQEATVPASPNITMATRKELEEMIENLEPHIDDPDVKGIAKIWKYAGIFV